MSNTAPDQAWSSLATAAEAQVLTAVSSFESIKITEAELTHRAATAILTANATAAKVSDLAVARLLKTLTLGLTPPRTEHERLAQAITTILSSQEKQPGTLRTRAARVARSEPEHAGRQTYLQALAARQVTHWRRITHPGACGLCLAQTGEIPTTEQFWHHPGCTCTIEPILQDEGEKQ